MGTLLRKTGINQIGILVLDSSFGTTYGTRYLVGGMGPIFIHLMGTLYRKTGVNEIGILALDLFIIWGHVWYPLLCWRYGPYIYSCNGYLYGKIGVNDSSLDLFPIKLGYGDSEQREPNTEVESKNMHCSGDGASNLRSSLISTKFIECTPRNGIPYSQ